VLYALALPAVLALGYYAYSHRAWWAGLLPAVLSAAVADYPLEVTSAAVVSGELKGREVDLPLTDYPAAAKLERITGTVRVEVWADRAGRVAAARALDGPEPLRAAAEEAARQARFKPRGAAGRTGTIKYDFMLCRDSGDCL
jgi:TonB family protein